jgi:hypothetical protein
MGEWFKKYGGLVAFFILVRALSFALRAHEGMQELIAAVLIGGFTYYCIQNISFAWQLLALELLLDGAGHFFELRGLLLRTWFLGIFGACWAWRKFRTRTKIIVPKKNILITLGVFGVVLVLAGSNGLLLHNAPHFVVQDFILYAFLLLMFPALEFGKLQQPIYRAGLQIFIIGSAFFSIITFALYASGHAILQNQYYHWFRDVAAGKITDLGQHFFRIVTAEQILFVPIILVLVWQLIKTSRDKKMWGLLFCSLIVVILNFTRIYFLSLAVGALILLWRTPWKKWLTVVGYTCVAASFIFFAAHAIASRGESIGLELLGVRIGHVTKQTDPSAAIRMALLPDILQHMRAHPLRGSGLGTEISYVDPITHETKTRTQFDWGYFEMIVELGALGAATYVAVLCMITRACAQTELIAGAAALAIINITTPALFQGFGVLYFVFLIVVGNEKLNSKIVD